MDSHHNKKKEEKNTLESICPSSSCFFCIMKEQDPFLRRAGIAKFFREMPRTDDQEHVLVLSGLWNLAMAHPNDPEFPSLGIFYCMKSLIHKGITNRAWLLSHQNIYIPYYAAHIIGSYTIKEAKFAELAVNSGVIPPLIELLRGKMTWVEQRVAVRALGHLASYETTFDVVAQHEEEIVELSMKIASTCLDVVYVKFVGVKDRRKRLKYQCDLLTRGTGSLEMENRKAEEWASQIQCWALSLLNCFASKERCLHLICRDGFLKDLCKMWGGLVNDSSPGGVGLLRILCYSKIGRKCVAECEEIVESLCNLSRSSDGWQYMGIDCLLLLLRDPDTRFKVMEISAIFLVNLVELRDLGGRKKVGDSIAKALLLDYEERKFEYKKSKGVEKALELVWDLKVEMRKREKRMSKEDIEEKMVLVGVKKHQGNERFWSGNVEEAVEKYTEALELCPLKMRKERVVLYSNRTQCHLLLKDVEAAISDATRALCLSNPVNSHKKSLWRRSQAYDMKGLAKESLMDCIMFVNGCSMLKDRKHVKVPYYASRMINKQMNVTWIFAGKGCKKSNEHKQKEEEEEEEIVMKNIRVKEKMGSMSGLSTIIEEPSSKKERRRRKPEKAEAEKEKKKP
ncbi:uncharacterized protein LOC143875712 [Tasmannia lanceolata]|uniref:uncharacterized protein LOC143875712 n=1 Tax=Tasmannia lanceolata TaxID=3420 RepID=UPI0040637BFA